MLHILHAVLIHASHLTCNRVFSTRHLLHYQILVGNFSSRPWALLPHILDACFSTRHPLHYRILVGNFSSRPRAFLPHILAGSNQVFSTMHLAIWPQILVGIFSTRRVWHYFVKPSLVVSQQGVSGIISSDPHW